MFLSDVDMKLHTIICKNAYMIRDLLIIDEKEVPYKQKSCKEYYIATVLDEIIRFATSVIRWQDDFKDGFNQEIVDNLVGNLIIQGLNNEINMYHRKFIESLTNLLLWRNLNEEIYVKYYYLIKEYNDCKNRIGDLNEFYNIRSIKTNNELDQIKSMIKLESNNIDENKCFFLNFKKSSDINGKRLYVNEASFKSKLKKALSYCTSLDKSLLGFSYEHYSYASGKIHFATKTDMQSPEILGRTIRFIFVMINRIISICAEILEVSDLDEIENIDMILEKVKDSLSWYTPLVEDIYDLDDYVYTLDGKLGRIIDKVTSRYGYRSYKIRFIDDNGEGIIEDYFPAQYFKRIQPKEELYKQVFASEPSLKRLHEVRNDEEFLRETLENGLKILWNLGLKKRLLNIQTQIDTKHT